MQFVEFALERWQSTWENRVRYNLSESGVHPLSIGELLELAGSSADKLLQVRLGYSQSNGTDLLRTRIAALYPGGSPQQILVTTRSAEANFVVCWRLIETGGTGAVQGSERAGGGDRLPPLGAGRRGGSPGGGAPGAQGAGQGAGAHAPHPPDQLPGARARAQAVRRHVQLAPAPGRGDLPRQVPPRDRRPRAGGAGARRAQRAARAGRAFRPAAPHPLRGRRGAQSPASGAPRDRAGPEARVPRLTMRLVPLQAFRGPIPVAVVLPAV